MSQTTTIEIPAETRKYALGLAKRYASSINDFKKNLICARMDAVISVLSTLGCSDADITALDDEMTAICGGFDHAPI